MCGILLHYNKNNKVNKTWLEDKYSLLHRGGDNFKTIYQNNIGVSHYLLSLTGDIENPQPFYKNKNIYAVNGEFYNYQKEQNKIEKKKIKSDSELLIDVYEKRDLKESLKKGVLQGEFVGLIYDDKKEKVILFSDHFGIKPLYYKIDKESVYIFSEIKSLKKINQLDFDNNSLNSVLSLQYHSVEDTLFKNIKRVPPSTIIEIGLNTFNIKQEKYYNLLDIKEDNNITEKEAIKDIKKLIKSSVQKRLFNKRKKVGVTLSGGIDSNIIFSESYKEAEPYIVKFTDGNFYDETNIALESAKKYNKKLNIINLNAKKLIDNFPKAIIASEDIAMNLHVSAKYLLFDEMKKHNIKISLSGEGSDEIFLGYEHLQKDLGKEINETYLEGIHSTNDNYFSDEEAFFIKEKMGFIPNFLNAKSKIGYEIKNYKKNINNGLNVKNIFEKLDFTSNKNNVYKSSYLWSNICLSNYILIGLGDKMEMNSNISSRIPFLDYDLVNYVSKIPVDLKANGNIEKLLLRNSFKDKVTEKVYKNKKHPFISPPLFKWSKEISEKVDKIIKNEISILDFIDHKKILLAKEHNTLSESAFFILWSLSILKKEYC